MTRFRTASIEDVEKLGRLETAAFGDDHAWSREALEGKVRDSGRPAGRSGALVLVTGELSAYATFQWVVDEAELLRVAVRPDARRKGLAHDLLVEALRRLREHGVASCHLEVRADNEAALALYRRLGFEPVGARRAYYRDGCDARLFRLSLARRSGAETR